VAIPATDEPRVEVAPDAVEVDEVWALGEDVEVVETFVATDVLTGASVELDVWMTAGLDEGDLATIVEVGAAALDEDATLHWLYQSFWYYPQSSGSGGLARYLLTHHTGKTLCADSAASWGRRGSARGLGTTMTMVAQYPVPPHWLH
jgi:hypothetical protein